MLGWNMVAMMSSSVFNLGSMMYWLLLRNLAYVRKADLRGYFAWVRTLFSLMPKVAGMLQAKDKK